MGATNCPETPRQRMISMMYLVLTALLALNVSAEIINAFVLFDEAISRTTENFVTKNEKTYSNFVAAMQENPEKTKHWKGIADELKQRSDEMCEYMDELKKEIVETGGGMNEPEDGHGEEHNGNSVQAKLIKKKDDQNVGSQIMIGSDGKGKGVELEQKFDEFRDWMVSKVTNDNGLKAALERSLATDAAKHDGAEIKWYEGYFAHMPLVACITSLSKLQSDIRNAEADLLGYLYRQIDAGSFTFNKLDGTVIAKSNYVMSGDAYEADIFLAAFDTTKSPDIYIGKYDTAALQTGETDYKKIMLGEEDKDYYKLDSVVDGKGKYNVKEGIGPHEVQGVIFFETGKGESKRVLPFPFYNEYQVAQGSVVISPTKMNVFYIGVDNPVEISVPGVPQDKIRPSISGGGGSIRSAGKGGYTVRVSTPTQNCKISVSAEVNGGNRNMGAMQFRVKRVPDPVAKVAGMKGGNIKKTLLMSQAGVKAELENFDFDLTFNVVGFTVSASIGGFTQESPCSGARFNAKALNIMKQVKRGQKVYIEDVKAKGPDGSVRKLGTIAFKLS